MKQKLRILLLMTSIVLTACGKSSNDSISNNTISENKVSTTSQNIIVSPTVSKNIIDDMIEDTIIEEEIIEEDITEEILEEHIIEEEPIIEEYIEEPIIIEPEDIIIEESVPIVEETIVIPMTTIESPEADWSDYGNSDSHILIIGDSRLVALCGYTDIEQRYKVIAQGGATSRWIGTDNNPSWTFRNDNSRINTFNDTMTGTINLSSEVLSEYGVDTIVIMLGINDLTDQVKWGYNALNGINNTISAFKSAGCRVIFNNVGYVRTGSGYEGVDSLTKDIIDTFNSQVTGYDLKINCFAGLPNSYNCDGLHYAPEEQQGILNLLVLYIGN